MTYYDSLTEQAFFEEKLREQERLVANGLLIGLKAQLLQEKMILGTTLNLISEDMKYCTSTTYVNNIREGFTGQTAKAAESYLTETLKKPQFNNPAR